MKTWAEHVNELAAILVKTRDIGGSEHQAIKDYLADNGFAPNSVNAPVITVQAIKQANAANKGNV